MKVDRVGGREYYTVQSRDDFSGWDVLLIERYKSGVCRVHLKTPVWMKQQQSKVVYAEDGLLPEHWVRPAASLGSRSVILPAFILLSDHNAILERIRVMIARYADEVPEAHVKDALAVILAKMYD